jgi:hypothetical protein
MPGRTGSAGLALALLAAAQAARAAEARLTADLDRTEVALGETAELVVRLVSDGAPDQVELPQGGPGFRVVRKGESTQTQVALEAGGLVMRRVSVWRLAVEPLRAGTLVIPGPVAVVGGKRHTHRDLELAVVDAPRRARPASPDDEPGPPPDRPGSMSWKGWQRDLALRLRLDRKEAFVGEQVTATLELVSPVALVGEDAYRPASLDGFWAEDLRVDQRERIETSGGVPLRVILLKKLALFPNRPGALTVGPFELEFRVQIASRDPFGLFPEVRRARRQSRPVSVAVKPLPPGAPAGFEPGNVGEWSLSREAPAGEQPAGQPFAVKLVARGTGNLKTLSLPGLPPTPGLRAFDPAASDEVKPQGDRLGGARTVETLVALEREGTVKLPAVEWPYFDPRAGRYQRARLPELRLAAGPAAAAPRARADAAASGAELRPLRPDGELWPRRPPAWRSPWFLGAAVAPPLLFAALALGLQLRDGLARGEGARRRRGAADRARRRLAGARRRLAAGEVVEAYGDAARALEGYAADRLATPVAGLTREALASALARAGARGPAAGLLARALEACDAGRFGGAAGLEDLLARAEEAVARLEETEWRPPGGAA